MQLPEGQSPERVRCGYLTVEEQHGHPNGHTIKLAVAILRSTSPNPEPDPVVYLSGGPGSPSLAGEMQGIGMAKYGAFIQSKRDFIFFDQRGTGLSQPGLFCPEVGSLGFYYLAKIPTPAEAHANHDRALLKCRDRLIAEGVNPAAYNSVESAHDIADLMSALGYGDYNLFGGSYGGRLAYTAMRETPQHIRSVITDSGLPIQANAFVDPAPDMQASLRQVFDACAQQAACHAAYPDFEQQFWDDVHRANEHPFEITVKDADGNLATFKVSGDTLLSGTFLSLYSTSSIAVLPLATDAIARGDYGIVATLAQQLVGTFTGFADAEGISVTCNEEVPFLTPALMNAANRGVRQDIIHAEVNTSTPTESALRETQALCEAWGTPKPSAMENQAVESDIPALILNGQLDPITPPRYGKLAAEKLSRGYVFEFPATAHGVWYQQYDCATAIIDEFLTEPAVKPESSCISQIPPLEFVIGEAASPAPPAPPTPVASSEMGITLPNTGAGPAGMHGSRHECGWAYVLFGVGTCLLLAGLTLRSRARRGLTRGR